MNTAQPLPGPHEREQALFLLALGKLPNERAAWLDRECGSDLDLRARLGLLLAAHDQPDSKLDSPIETIRATIALKLPEDPLAEAVGKMVGRYKLLEKIGEGGCGVVYVAEQTEPVRRRVALKVIKLGMDTKAVVARFEAERQALAMMDHPNIAKVLDAGSTETGRPYFVMELVRGVRITDYCDQNHVSTQERLDLFIKVCHAIQHAHQKGIIHRDIKPSNILVTLHDGVPVPKVIDFGIAKATQGRLTDATVYTQLHQFIGTPAYMSPEQAEMSGLDIDTRSDVYSLGVLLYELLTGRTPFDAQELLKSGLDAIRKTIREVEPPRPSTRLSTLRGEALTATAKTHGTESMPLVNLVKGDLDCIVMKCLEKDRTHRYETANGLAVDLKRHLDNEPVMARPPSKVYRFQKAWRRNKGVFAAATLIAFVLLVATGISAWQAVRATRADKLSTQRLAESEAVSKFMTEVFQSPDPARRGRTITVAETLGEAAKKLETNFTSQPAIRAKLQATLGNTYQSLGLYPEAIALQEETVDYYSAVLGRKDPETLNSMLDLANSCESAGLREEALKLREEVLEMRRKILGPEHPDTLAAFHGLANSYDEAGRRDEALKLREQVLELRRKVSGPDHPETLKALQNLANSYDEAGRRDQALKLREQALGLLRKVLGPDQPETLKALENLARSYDEAGRRDEALKLREQALELYRKVLGPDHPETFTALDSLALSYDETGQRKEALKLREDLLELRREVLGPEHPDTLVALLGLAESYDEVGRRAEGLKLREQVLELRRKVLGPEHPDTIGAMNNLAVSYEEAGRNDEALKLREQVFELCRKVDGPEHPDTLNAMHNLANSYDEIGRREEALKLREQVLELRRQVLGPEHPLTLTTLNNVANSYDEVGRREEALKLREQALELYRKVLGPEHPDTLLAMNNLAISYDEAGRRDEALKLREQPLELYRKVLGPEHPDTIRALSNLADSYDEAGRRNEALKLREQVVEWCRKTLGSEHPMTLGAMQNLANSYDEMGRRDEALKLRQQLLEGCRKVLGPEHPDTLTALLVLANSYDEVGRREEALKLREETFELHRKVLGPEHPETLVAMNNLAISYDEAGRRDEAVKLRKQVLELRRKVLGQEHPDTLTALEELAWSYDQAGRRDEALSLREQLLPLSVKVMGPSNQITLNAMEGLGDCYVSIGRGKEAIALLAKQCALDPKDTEASLKLATWEAWFGEDGDFEATRRRVVQLADETDNAITAERAAKTACMRAGTNAGLLAQALSLAQRGVELGKTNNSDWLPWGQLALGLAEYRNAQYAEAERTLTVAEQTAGAEPEIPRTARFYRTMSLFRQGKAEEARRLFSQAETQMLPFPKDESKLVADGKTVSADDVICWLAYKEAKNVLDDPRPGKLNQK